MKNLCKLALCLMLLAGVTLVGWAAPARADGAGYTVEFTYNKLEYVLPGDTSVAMSEILTTLGLSGEVTAVEISDTSLFSASNETGVWIVTAHKAFSTTEWMKVTIGGVAYEITVTDEQESVSYLDASGAAQACATYTILSADSSITWGSGWYVAEAGTLTIGSRVTVSGDVHLILCDNAAFTVTGGINVAGNNSLTIYAQSTGSDKGALIVSGVADNNAGIGGNSSQSGGTITVNGGNITVTGGQYCAGIGGSYYSSHGGAGGTVTVNGGTVTATGGEEGAGIGGGKYGEGGNITISGGTVNATGGVEGAGIGGGYGLVGGTITVSGGTVTATGGDYGAGIGGGLFGAGGNITVTGGTVTANGGKFAAGIGGGDEGAGGTIIVTGGNITANGSSNYGTGIGASSRYSGSEPGTLTVGFDNTSDSLKATSYSGAVSVAANKVLADGSAYYAGELSGDEKSTISNKTLQKNDTAYIVHRSVTGSGAIAVSPSAALPDTEITFTLSPTAGSVLLESGVTYTDGSATITPTQDASDPTKYTFTMPAAHVTVSAVFGHTVTVSDSIIGGSVSANKGSAADGTTVNLTVSPDSGYVIGAVRYIDGTDHVIEPVNGEYSFTMPDADVTVSATFLRHIETDMTVLLGGILYDAGFPHTGDPVEPAVTVVDYLDNNKSLTPGTDFTVSYSNNVNLTTDNPLATATITGIGAYTGTVTEEFRITPYNIGACELKGTLEAYDDGYGPYNPLSENVQVLNNGTPLTLDTDYKLEIEEADSWVVNTTYHAVIIGRGDWGGSIPFDFKLVALHHTVVFVANGGSGEMESVTVANNGGYAGIYYLPECGFTAPEGQIFDHWVVDYKDIKEDPVKQPGQYFTAPYIYQPSDVQTITVTAYYRDKASVTLTASNLEHASLLVNGAAAELTEGVAQVTEDDVITVVPDNGYELVSVAYTPAGGEETTLSPDDTGACTFTMPAGNVTVNAVFAKLYALNLPVGEPYGSVTAFVNGAEATEARSGETVSLVFTLNEGYQIQYAFPSPVTAFYTLDGTEKKKDAYSESGNTYTFTMPAADISSWRVLNGRSICTVKFDPDNEGTLSQNNVYYGDSVGCPGDPSKEGFRFLGWYQVLGESLADAPFDFEMSITGDITLRAKWEQLYAVAIDGNITGGTVSADKETAAEDETVTLTVEPATGYALDTLTVMQGETPVTVTNNQFTMPAGDVTVSATFVRVYTIHLSKNPYITQTFTVDGEAVTPIDADEYNMTLQIPAGAVVSITAAPVDSSEHRIEAIYIRREDTHNLFGTVTDGENGARTASFTMVEAEVNVDVNVMETGWRVDTGVPVYDRENVIFKVTATPHHGEAGTPITLTVEKADEVTLDSMAYIYQTAEGAVITVPLTLDADGKYTFTMPDSGVRVEPKYYLTRKHQIINQLGDGPSVGLVLQRDENNASWVETTTANAGDKVRVYPNGATLQDFKVNGTEVKVSGYESDPYYEFTMPDGDATLTGSVTYRLQTYGVGFAHGTVTVQVGDEVTDLSTVQSLSVPVGAQVIVTATPNAGYKLYRLSYRMDGQYGPGSDEKGGVEIQSGVPFTMPGGNTVIDVEFSTPWNKLRQQIDNAQDGDTITLTEDAIAPAGEGYLSIQGKAITIDLNGHTIDRNLTDPINDGCVIYVDSGAALTLVDSAGGGKITGGNNNNKGGGIAVAGTLNLQGGKITGNSANYGGGVAVINSGAVFNLTGGEISGNAKTSAESSAGVYYTSGTMNVSGSPVVTDAVYVDWNCKLHVTGPLTNATPIPVIIYDGVSVTFTDGLPNNGSAANFKSANDDYRVRVNASGEAELYAPTFYTVTCASCENGSVTVFGDKTSFAEGDAVTLSAAPATGYVLTDLTVTYTDGEGVAQTITPTQDGTDKAKYTFTMPAVNVTATATFKQVFTISFSAGEGATGTMDPVTVPQSEAYTLPDASAFTAPAGKVFKEWSVKISDAEAVCKRPDESVVVTADTTVTAVWENLSALVFAGYTLRFGGVLGLNFYLELPEGFDGTGAQMTFTIEGNTQTLALSSPNVTTETINGHEYRVFPCNVYAYQMAETITAEFSYGENQSVTKEYSVKRYLDGITEGQYSGNAKALVTATRAYGHFIQPYLHDVNGTTHAAMDYSGTVNVEAAKTGAAGYALSRTISDTYVDSVQYYLTVSASTTLNMEIKLKDNVTGNVTVLLDGKGYAPTVSGNTYKVTISSIAANNLGAGHSLVFKVGEDTAFSTENLSALTYVNTVLTYSSDDHEKAAMAALYDYAQAAITYAAHPNE